MEFDGLPLSLNEEWTDEAGFSVRGNTAFVVNAGPKTCSTYVVVNATLPETLRHEVGAGFESKWLGPRGMGSPASLVMFGQDWCSGIVSFNVPSRMFVLSRKWRLTPMLTQTHPFSGSTGHDVDASGAAMTFAGPPRAPPRATTP